MDYEEIVIPEIKTPDISYGYTSDTIKGSQIDASNNRQIAKTQFYAFSINTTSGSLANISTSTNYDVIYTGRNLDLQKTFSANLLATGIGDLFGGAITKYYNIDTFYENNGSTEQGGIIYIPSGRVVEVTARFSTSTQGLRLSIVSGSVSFLYGNISGLIDLNTTNSNTTFISGGTTSLKLKIQWNSSTNNGSSKVTERPNFGILMKIF